MAASLKEFRDALKPDRAFVTDVGSVKGSVDARPRAAVGGSRAGSAAIPWPAASRPAFPPHARIFSKMLPSSSRPRHNHPGADAAARIEFWQALGARVLKLRSRAEHDDRPSRRSATCRTCVAAELLVQRQPRTVCPCWPAGSGFRDTTRIASGSPELWAEILWANSRRGGLASGGFASVIYEAARGDRRLFEREALKAAKIRSCSRLLQNAPRDATLET